MIQKINITEKFDLITKHFRPKTVTELNGQAFQLAKIKGDYPWHAHPEEDEMFFCWKGAFTLDIEGQDSVDVGEGECITVPKGTRHRPRANEECWIFLIEPVGTKNNGDAAVDAIYDAPVGAWV